MLFEFVSRIDWITWIERIICATSIFLVLVIFIWVIPIFANWTLAMASVHAKIRQGMVMILRLIMVTCGIFLIADILGFESDTVFAVLGTVFGVGISWAIKDNGKHLTTLLTDVLSSKRSVRPAIIHVPEFWDWRQNHGSQRQV